MEKHVGDLIVIVVLDLVEMSGFQPGSIFGFFCYILRKNNV